MAFAKFLDDARSVSMRYDPETDRLIQQLSRMKGVTPGVVVRMAFRELPDVLDDEAVAWIIGNVNRMEGRRTTWVEDRQDRARLDSMVFNHNVSRRGVLRYAVRVYAKANGLKVREAAA